MTNDYKPDTGKPPVMDAVFIPYRRTLLAIAAMKADMAVKHKLQGAKDPFLEWVQLPDAKRRLANAGARHALQPWAVNTADGRHLHIIHAIVGLMMAAEIHLTDQEKVLAMVTPEPLPDLPELDNACKHLGGIVAGTCVDCHETLIPVQRADALHERARIELHLQGERQASPLHGPAGADWREPQGKPTDKCECGHSRCMHATAEPVHVCGGIKVLAKGTLREKRQTCLCRTFKAQAAESGQYWTGDSATWLCTCGAGRPAACICNRSNGEHS